MGKKNRKKKKKSNTSKPIDNSVQKNKNKKSIDNLDTKIFYIVVVLLLLPVIYYYLLRTPSENTKVQSIKTAMTEVVEENKTKEMNLKVEEETKVEEDKTEKITPEPNIKIESNNTQNRADEFIKILDEVEIEISNAVKKATDEFKDNIK